MMMMVTILHGNRIFLVDMVMPLREREELRGLSVIGYSSRRGKLFLPLCVFHALKKHMMDSVCHLMNE